MMKTSAGSFLSCAFTSQANPIAHTLMIFLPAAKSILNKQLSLMWSALINLVPQGCEVRNTFCPIGSKKTATDLCFCCCR